MEDLRIAYPAQIDGVKVCVLHPTGELPLEETAVKDTPIGLPFKYINVSDIPTTPHERAEWQVDFSNPDGYGMGGLTGRI